MSDVGGGRGAISCVTMRAMVMGAAPLPEAEQ